MKIFKTYMYVAFDRKSVSNPLSGFLSPTFPLWRSSASSPTLSKKLFFQALLGLAQIAMDGKVAVLEL